MHIFTTQMHNKYLNLSNAAVEIGGFWFDLKLFGCWAAHAATATYSILSSRRRKKEE